MHQRSITFAGLLLLVAAGCACSKLVRQHPPDAQLLLEIVASSADREAAAENTIRTIESRLNALGVTFEVKPQGTPSDGRIAVNLWQVADLDRLKKIIPAAGKLELTHVISDPSPAACRTYDTKDEAISAADKSGKLAADRRVLPYAERAEIGGNGAETSRPTKWVIVDSSPIIDGSELRNASAVPTGNRDDYEILFSLKKTGAEKLGNWTGANINEYLAVVLNDEVKSVAFIKSQIFDQGEINGHFTRQSAEDLALVLKSGSLPYPVRIVGTSGAQQK
jgi:preprotein translocase subunit SecD